VRDGNEGQSRPPGARNCHLGAV